MIYIILLILKTIGILLLSIIGILIILILMILFVPVRYRVTASKYNDIHMNVVVSWFLHAITYRQVYNGSEIVSQMRIFGFVIKDREKPKTKKIKRTKRNKTKIRKKHKADVEIAEIKSHEIKEKSLEDINLKEIELGSETSQINEILHLEESQGNSKKNGFMEKLRNYFRNIKKLLLKIPEFLIKVKTNYLNIIAEKDNVIRKISLVGGYLKKEENKLGLKKIWWATKKSLKHIFPKKLRFNIHFGTGDPCSTGLLLGVIGITYHLYQKNVTIVADFTEEVYEGDIFARGRIRLFTILIIGIRVLLNKNFKQLLKGYNELKEEL